ncbi:MAG TPA: hypothetical protein VEB69_14290 [Acidimicrobiia bacterium]|nr:hypothetical protein [Acidimicrobiia bacterium]
MKTVGGDHDRNRRTLTNAMLFALLILTAVSMALLALVDPGIDLSLAPGFTFSPPSPHLHP